MKKIYKYSACLLLSLFMAACGDNPFAPEYDDPETMGSISTKQMMVELNTKETEVRSVITDNFIVEIVDKADDKVVESYKYSQMPEIIPLKAGDYTVKVRSGENAAQAWDAPYYEGSQDITVVAKKISDVTTVTCSLANVRVSIFYDENLKAHMSSDCKVNVKVGDNGVLDFSANETRSGYFAYVPGSNTLVATFTGTIDGTVQENFKSYTDVAPSHHYKITYRYSNADAPDIDGQITIGEGITIDVTVEDVNMSMDNALNDDELLDDNDRPQEDPLDPEDPGDTPSTPDDPGVEPGPEVVPPAGVEWGKPYPVTSESEVKIQVNSKTGLTGFTVDIISDKLTPEELENANLSSHLDFVNPGELEEAFVGLGFPVNVGGEKSVLFDVTNFMGALCAIGGGCDHTFRLTVTDAEGTVIKDLILSCP